MSRHSGSKRKSRRQRFHQGRLRLYLIRQTFQLLGPLFPSLMSRWAYLLWTRTHRYPEPAREKHMRLRANEHSFLVNNQKVKAWGWGKGQGPLVLLIHGWNGRGMQMAGFVDPLLKSGYRVMCFDAPGHGLSQGNHSSIIDIRDVIKRIAEHEGPVHAAIAHSFGVACLSASIVEGFTCSAVVAISSPGGYQNLLDGYSDHLRIPDEVKQRLKAILVNHIGMNFWEDFSPNVTSGQLPDHCLVVHDADDKTVDWHIGESLAKCWPNADFFLTEGLGHRRLLLSGKLARHITHYLDNIPIFDTP